METLSLDAHSGLGGSIFPNAAWRLVWALGTLKGPDGHVRIPGFYDNVVKPSARDMQLLEALPDRAAEMRATYGITDFLYGLEGVELRREEVFVPTCTICGLTSGYQGPGSKTVLPPRTLSPTFTFTSIFSLAAKSTSVREPNLIMPNRSPA